ncbi:MULTISPECIES: restriction endonuclease subunit R [unclassified Roseofilum]|uniref:restriction endonuclease subunit R n=1 Tax=unclassified Roseofilum TaxID=2620099 RepID=UPI000E7DBAD9|nr:MULTISPECIES: restriction endonuclease subunit R [unclassified Roseofilum]HBQ97740.1 restriction endonuclease subunit R [Cyanobacteria bacterium UBA11691]MBP0007995.1 restriction endonuclease subunit R [Roseofilum sp. Belize Diploria]MBP0036037.1 restriction endonuclease subunit R [Roseofilum sp. Belize BBD 4]MBP0037421.1 restriction endonuclease subunit R [Roseofilum sp. SID1]MBP0044790.1 restriction endonuclease subunit R [Roseofilum sp. SBFL]
MPTTVPAQTITLRELIDRFGLTLTEDEEFFPEWQENLPEISQSDRQLLDKVKAGYINLLNHPPLLENVVRMAILDPILFIGNFYIAPFYVKSEEPIEISAEDEGVIIKGRIDTLILKEQFWIVAIESKKASFSIEEALPQILVYMLASPHPARPCFGMIATGGSFIFVKLVRGDINRYALSKGFLVRNPGNELYEVLRILKRLSQL